MFLRNVLLPISVSLLLKMNKHVLVKIIVNFQYHKMSLARRSPVLKTQSHVVKYVPRYNIIQQIRLVHMCQL
jgi:hypothetical protein